MTFRPPLIITIYPRRKAPDQDYNVRILAQIAPNPSKPFHQDDWPAPTTLGKVQDSAAPTNQFPFLHPNPSKPFHQDDWSQQAKPLRPKAIVDDFVNVLMGQTFRLIKQDLWENATLPRPKAIDSSAAPPPALLTPNPSIPFNQNLWDGEPGRLKAKVDDFVNLTPIQSNIVVQFPFELNDWPPAPLPPPKIIDTSLAASSPLYTPNPAQPFNQTQWDRPVQGLPPLKSDIYVNLPAPPPFSESDWPSATLGRQKIGADSYGIDLPLKFPFVQAPFIQGDWPSAILARQKIHAESFGINLPLKFPNPTQPFIYTDWPRTRDRIAEVQRTWLDAFNLPLNGVLPPPPGTPPLQITDTNHLQLPIDAVLMGQQDMEVGHTEIESNDPNIRTRTKVSKAGGGRLSSNEPSFTTTTNKKGYD